MNSFKAMALSLGLLACASLATADQWNKKTILTINETIQVPGKVLPPGKYVMKLLDSPSNRHIVQIFNEDESQIQTTILAIPNYRLRPTGDSKFGFWETPAGQPKALRSWFYPGDNFGQEFAYPKDMAMVLARSGSMTVPTTENMDDLRTARVTQIDQSGAQTELDRKTYTAPAEEAVAKVEERVEVAQATPPPAAEPVYTPAPTPAATPEPVNTARVTETHNLPATGSPIPLIGLAGLISFGAAGLLRLRKLL